MITYQSKIFLFGGKDKDYNTTNKCYIIHSQLGEVEPIGVLDQPRYFHTIHFVTDLCKAFVIGGFNDIVKPCSHIGLCLKFDMKN